MRKIIKLEGNTVQPVRRKRVAAYARVSLGKDAMLHSLSAQISYYNDYIGSRGDWELAGIYADKALTGTKEDRPEFQRMLSDCRAGKIDMVITKSLTRLARNTVTLLATVRELKLLDVDVYFEKENIHTLTSDGELMLTLLASFAQEESRSASENQKWRIQKMFEEGRLHTGRMVGYRFVNGTLEIVPEEAEIVKMIFADFLSGMGRNAIMKKLNRMNIPAARGEHWGETVISKILRNEKYTGNMLLQKTYQSDHISKKTIINHGERPMYYVENSHEAIISAETFERAQQELECRAKKLKPRAKAPQYIFTSLIHCGLCGKHFHRGIVKNKSTKPVWACSTSYTYGKNACPAQRIPEYILLDKTSEVLGIDELSRESLLEHITEILVPGHNRLVYVFRDGHTQEVTWQYPSRRELWTEEMRQKARENAPKREERKRKNDGTH